MPRMEHARRRLDNEDTWSPTIRFVMGCVFVGSFHMVEFAPAPPACKADVVIRDLLQRFSFKVNCWWFRFFPSCFVTASAWCFHQRSLSFTDQTSMSPDPSPTLKWAHWGQKPGLGTRFLTYDDHCVPQSLHNAKYLRTSSIGLLSSSNFSLTHLLKLGIFWAFSYVVGQRLTILCLM